MMNSYCVVRGCQSRYFPNSRISRHRIPKDVSTRSKWLKAIGFGESKVNDASRVCSKHFLTTDFLSTPFDQKISNSQGNTPKLMKFRLKQNAVPSIFPKKNVCGVHTFPTQRILSIDDVILCLNETHLPSGVMSYFDFEKEQWLFMGMDYVNGGSPHVMFSVVLDQELKINAWKRDIPVSKAIFSRFLCEGKLRSIKELYNIIQRIKCLSEKCWVKI
ncbi:uncharacterized protein [Lepeophtheirus salmonis]|uniref:Putative LOC102231700 [Xiphosphorus maculatus] n=1 Tax=Lepeophtheirus salmonis TaxID=72036 RepID=A0A0K2SXN1_LEPSM|nr:uncharacterized protein LOC121114656 [Lepeophtheirus salmonis]XP_040582996.1 uncharacterized protein LOC121131711 [Lepeophtheirus salmonis]